MKPVYFLVLCVIWSGAFVSAWAQNAGPIFYVLTGDGITKIGEDGTKQTVFAMASGVDMVQDGEALYVYAESANHITVHSLQDPSIVLNTLPIPERANGDTLSVVGFEVLPMKRVALLDNRSNNLSFISFSGDLLATVPIGIAPDSSRQHIDGDVWQNNLIYVFGRQVYRIDLDTYENTLLKDYSGVSGFFEDFMHLEVSEKHVLGTSFNIAGRQSLTSILFDGHALADTFSARTDFSEDIVALASANEWSPIRGGQFGSLYICTNDSLNNGTGNIISPLRRTEISSGLSRPRALVVLAKSLISDKGNLIAVPKGGAVMTTISLPGTLEQDAMDWFLFKQGRGDLGFEDDVSIHPSGPKSSAYGEFIWISNARGALTISVSNTSELLVEVVGLRGVCSSMPLQLFFSEQVPVELGSFSGEYWGEQVVIRWGVVSQTNNAGWYVLRSDDGVVYDSVSDLIVGNGTTDAFAAYRFEDADVSGLEKVYYKLQQIDLDGNRTLSDPIEVVIDRRRIGRPVKYALAQNFPNPFNPETTISYSVAVPTQIKLAIYNVMGQEIRTLVNAEQASGKYQVVWNGRDEFGREVSSGIYLYRFVAGEFVDTRKMLILK